jgi:hypothetical protein
VENCVIIIRARLWQVPYSNHCLFTVHPSANFNLWYNFWLVGAMTFIIHMCILSGKTFHLIPWPWSSGASFTKGLKTTSRIFSWLQSCGKLFYAPVLKDRGHIVFGLSICLSVCLQKTLTLAISFEWHVIGLSYFICVFLMTRPFYWYQNFWPWSLTHFSKTLTLAIYFEW